MNVWRPTLLFLVTNISVVHAQQPKAWTVETHPGTGNVSVINTSTESMNVKVTAIPEQDSRPVAIRYETCSGDEWDTKVLAAGSALCFIATAEPVVYIVRGSTRGTPGTTQATRVTAVQPINSLASLAFVKDTDDVIADPEIKNECNKTTGIKLTHTTLPNKQVFVCRTPEGVLQGFYPVDPVSTPVGGGENPPALSSAQPTRTSLPTSVQPPVVEKLASLGNNSGSRVEEPSSTVTTLSNTDIPTLGMGGVIPGVYTVPGAETLKDLKLTVRRPVYYAFWLILAGVVCSTLVGLLLTRWSAIQQLRTTLKMQGFAPDVKSKLTYGKYTLSTTHEELNKYLTWWRFWLPTEHAERLAQALITWRELGKDLYRLRSMLNLYNSQELGKGFRRIRLYKELQRSNFFKNSARKRYYVIKMLNRINRGGADLRKEDELDLSRIVELQDVESIQKSIYEAALLAEHLMTYRLTHENGATPEVKAAREALLRELDDVTDWQRLTAAEVQTYYAGLIILRQAMLNALVLERAKVANPKVEPNLRELVGNARMLNARLHFLKVRQANLGADSRHLQRHTSHTTLAGIAPLLLWNWVGVLVGALVAWLLGSVTGLQKLYFTGEPWGSTSMDYVSAFAYGAVTVAALASVVGIAKTYLPTAWQSVSPVKSPVAAPTIEEKSA